MHIVIAALLLALIVPGSGYAQVHVDIGINFPAPPQLVIVPAVPAVQYVPAAPANVFFYSGQYWVFNNGGWFVSRGYRGPWVVVGPQFVPRPLLLVPVRYYHAPPDHWKQWRHTAPPRWDQEWGREWADNRGWRGRGDDRDDRGDRGDRGDHGRGHGRR